MVGTLGHGVCSAAVAAHLLVVVLRSLFTVALAHGGIDFAAAPAMALTLSLDVAWTLIVGWGGLKLLVVHVLVCHLVCHRSIALGSFCHLVVLRVLCVGLIGLELLVITMLAAFFLPFWLVLYIIPLSSLWLGLFSDIAIVLIIIVAVVVEQRSSVLLCLGCFLSPN